MHSRRLQIVMIRAGFDTLQHIFRREEN